MKKATMDKILKEIKEGKDENINQLYAIFKKILIMQIKIEMDINTLTGIDFILSKKYEEFDNNILTGVYDDIKEATVEVSDYVSKMINEKL